MRKTHAVYMPRCGERVLPREGAVPCQKQQGVAGAENLARAMKENKKNTQWPIVIRSQREMPPSWHRLGQIVGGNARLPVCVPALQLVLHRLLLKADDRELAAQLAHLLLERVNLGPLLVGELRARKSNARE
jgi:hypothetical protein